MNEPNELPTLFAIGDRVRISRFGEWMNGTLKAYLFHGQVAVVSLDDGRMTHTLSTLLRQAVDE